jgi:hypothetical protein
LFRPYFVVLGHLPGTELYKDIQIYKDVSFIRVKISFLSLAIFKAKEIKGIKIIRMEESLHNTNAAFFKKKVYECTSMNPQEYISRKLKLERKKIRESEKDIPIMIKVLNIILLLLISIQFYFI